MSNYREIACKMMGVEKWEDLDGNLRMSLDTTAARVRACGGYLRSRQAIACIIDGWETYKALDIRIRDITRSRG